VGLARKQLDRALKNLEDKQNSKKEWVCCIASYHYYRDQQMIFPNLSTVTFLDMHFFRIWMESRMI
jgi:hypothetical protein